MNKNLHTLVYTIIITLLLSHSVVTLTGCTEFPPEPRVSFLELNAIDASCTEAWLRIRIAANSTPPYDVTLVRDEEHVADLRLFTADSLIVDDNLLPDNTYTYKAFMPDDSPFRGSIAQATITTLDTTSHEFTWEVYTLGDESSVLYDVAIINDTLVYVVGELNVRDSSGNLINPPYNLARWNGQYWEMLRLLWDCRLNYPDCGPSYFLFSPIRSIFAFGPNDIWVTAGTPQHFNGTRWTEYAGIEGVGGASKIWGTSSNDMYFVGHAGFIVHKSGENWHRLESGTEVDIIDIWGSQVSTSNKAEIACVASYRAQVPQARSLLVIENGIASIVPDTGLPLNLNSIWFVSGGNYYVSGSGLVPFQFS
jgi:hypothetical protein